MANVRTAVYYIIMIKYKYLFRPYFIWTFIVGIILIQYRDTISFYDSFQRAKIIVNDIINGVRIGFNYHCVGYRKKMSD